MRVLMLALVAVGFLSAADLKTVEDLEAGNLRYRCMIGKLPKEEFARTASLLLDRTEIALGAVALYGSVRDRLFANSHGLEGCGYDEWKGFTDRNDPWRDGCPEVQEAVKIGPNILLRTVDRDCRKSTSLVKGNADPLELVVNGKRVRVLHVSFSGGVGKGDKRWVGADMALRTDGAVSPELARAVTTQLKAQTRATYLSIILRSDLWFFESCGPVIFPFEPRPRTPSKAEWYGTKYAVCVASGDGPMQCYESASRP